MPKLFQLLFQKLTFSTMNTKTIMNVALGCLVALVVYDKFLKEALMGEFEADV